MNSILSGKAEPHSHTEKVSFSHLERYSRDKLSSATMFRRDRFAKASRSVRVRVLAKSLAEVESSRLLAKDMSVSNGVFQSICGVWT